MYKVIKNVDMNLKSPINIGTYQIKNDIGDLSTDNFKVVQTLKNPCRLIN